MLLRRHSVRGSHRKPAKVTAGTVFLLEGPSHWVVRREGSGDAAVSVVHWRYVREATGTIGVVRSHAGAARHSWPQRRCDVWTGLLRAVLDGTWTGWRTTSTTATIACWTWRRRVDLAVHQNGTDAGND